MTLGEQTNAPLPRLAPRLPNSHKGDYGRALLIGGSRGMSGAIALAGKAALRAGAGLVTLAVPSCVQGVVASIEPSYMTHALCDHDGRLTSSSAEELIELANHATAVALGPGLGRLAELTELVARLYAAVCVPMVVDADGLFALAQRPDCLRTPPSARILTPHPGEFARLMAQPYDPANRTEAATALAQRDATHRTVIVLKGHHTLVTDGSRAWINQTGNPGMATGGSGDVLTGIITALLCQGLAPFDAARLGTHVHGLAGDLAADELGQVSLIASDLIEYLPKAFKSLS